MLAFTFLILVCSCNIFSKGFEIILPEFLITELVTDYEGAHEFCSKIGSEIVRVDNIHVAKNINDQMNKVFPDSIGYWVNANDIKKKGKWVHSDGTPAATHMWHSGEPNNKPLGNCVIGKLQSNWLDWTNINCASKFRVICSQIPITEFFITEKISDFEGAHEICSKRGEEIVRVDNIHIAKNISDLLDEKFPNSIGYWVDVNDIKEEGTWVHADGTPAVTNMWYAGEPNDDRAVNCVIGKLHTDWIKWADQSCGLKYRVICSKLPRPINVRSCSPKQAAEQDCKFGTCRMEMFINDIWHVRCSCIDNYVGLFCDTIYHPPKH